MHKRTDTYNILGPQSNAFIASRCNWSWDVVGELQKSGISSCNEAHAGIVIPTGFSDKIMPPFTSPNRIHVWYIYLHLVDLYEINVGKYTIHGSYGSPKPMWFTHGFSDTNLCSPRCKKPPEVRLVLWWKMIACTLEMDPQHNA